MQLLLQGPRRPAEVAADVYLTAGGDGCLFKAFEPDCRTLNMTRVAPPTEESGKTVKGKVQMDTSSPSEPWKSQSALHS